jgi:hypothetical protein
VSPIKISCFASGLVVLKAKEEDIRAGLEKAARPFYFMATDLWKWTILQAPFLFSRTQVQRTGREIGFSPI